MNRLSLFILAAAFYGGCSQGEEQQRYDSLVLSAQRVEAPTTRATVDNTWRGGEMVAVRINDDNTPRTFTASAEGRLTPGVTLYWQHFGSSLYACAWYPQNYAFVADQSRGIQDADFIFAPTVSGITAGNSNQSSHTLRFYHQTAKVTVSISHGVGMSAGDISNATVRFLGYNACNADLSNGKLNGSSEGEIIPFRDNNTFIALLVPQDIAGNLIRIKAGGQDYYYSPAGVKLEAGNAYIFQIVVNKTGLTLSLANNGALWTAGSTETATSTFDERYYEQGVDINGTIWATRNVDAPGTFAPAPESAGMLYQWNRRVGWLNYDNAPLQNSDGGSDWNASGATGSTWASANDPCPDGWRLPTHNEFENLYQAGYYSAWISLNGVYGRYYGTSVSNSIFLPASGFRFFNNGELRSRGAYGHYWSSTVSGDDAYRFYLYNNNFILDPLNRADGCCVRCVKKQN